MKLNRKTGVLKKMDYLMVLFFILAFGVVIFYELEIRPQRYKNLKISIGKIKGTIGPNRSVNSLSLVYDYYDGITIKRSSQNGFRGANVDEFKDYVIGKNFPVIYKKGFWGIERILITPGDFKEFNLPYPDSLNYIKILLSKQE